MELQGIFATGKFIKFFRDEVISWQSRLGDCFDALADLSFMKD